MATSSSVPLWLIGKWNRRWIKRKEPKASDKGVKVVYLQTSYWFIDVRIGSGPVSFFC
jgi:hypothetical protein